VKHEGAEPTYLDLLDEIARLEGTIFEWQTQANKKRRALEEMFHTPPPDSLKAGLQLTDTGNNS